MTVPHLLEHLHDGVLLITAGDRADVIMTAAATRHAERSPRGVRSPADRRLSACGLRAGPARLRSWAAADRAPDGAGHLCHRGGGLGLRPMTSSSDERRIALSLGLFETHVDGADLAAALDVAESSVTTPLMFEHRLLARARADRRRIVLPEGNDDRVLLAAERILQRDVCDLVILDPDGSLAERSARLGVALDGARIVDPQTSELREQLAADLHTARAHKGSPSTWPGTRWPRSRCSGRSWSTRGWSTAWCPAPRTPRPTRSARRCRSSAPSPASRSCRRSS